jgi:hypothetical protein
VRDNVYDVLVSWRQLGNRAMGDLLLFIDFLVEPGMREWER